MRAWVIASLHNPAGKPLALEEIIDYLDWKNHSRYGEDEVLSILRRLEKEGLVIRHRRLWKYNLKHSQNDASYIF